MFWILGGTLKFFFHLFEFISVPYRPETLTESITAALFILTFPFKLICSEGVITTQRTNDRRHKRAEKNTDFDSAQSEKPVVR